MNVDSGSSRMTMLLDIVGINVPDPPRTINLEILSDFLGTISKVTIVVRSGSRLSFVCKIGIRCLQERWKEN